jgi:hypothetical protein
VARLAGKYWTPKQRQIQHESHQSPSVDDSQAELGSRHLISDIRKAMGCCSFRREGRLTAAIKRCRHGWWYGSPPGRRLDAHGPGLCRRCIRPGPASPALLPTTIRPRQYSQSPATFGRTEERNRRQSLKPTLIRRSRISEAECALTTLLLFRQNLSGLPKAALSCLLPTKRPFVWRRLCEADMGGGMAAPNRKKKRLDAHRRVLRRGRIFARPREGLRL